MAGPIRIAQILNRMDSGGVEAVVLNYYRAIDRSKVQFDFYFADKSFFPQRKELESLGAGIYLLPSYKNIFAYQAMLYKAFRAHRYAVVHAQMSTLSVLPLFAAWRAGVPVRICHAHSTAVRSEGLKTVFKLILRPLCGLFATDRFACGRAAGEWMYGKKAVARGNVQIVPNGIDVERFVYNAATRQAVREEYGVPQDAFVVGHVGRFVYQKNHAFLLNIFGQLCQIIPNAYLLLFGEGELQETIMHQAAEMGLAERVVFAGVRRDMAKCYSAMDVFCLPSFYEGMPVAAIEAQANGLPCLCSSAVSGEAGKDQRFQQISLDRPAAEWAERLYKLSQKRSTSPAAAQQMTEWDIHAHALRLQHWYEAAAKAAGER